MPEVRNVIVDSGLRFASSGLRFGPEACIKCKFSCYQHVYIGDDGTCFSGGTHSTKKGIRANQPYTHKLELRRVADGKPYIDNLGSQVIEDSPSELKIKLYQPRGQDPPYQGVGGRGEWRRAGRSGMGGVLASQ